MRVVFAGTPEVAVPTLEVTVTEGKDQQDFFVFLKLADGVSDLDARNALGFVRSRAYQEYVDGRWRTDPTGDLGRIRRQQQFIIAALERSVERGLRNPVTLDELIDSALGAVTIDDVMDHLLPEGWRRLLPRHRPGVG